MQKLILQIICISNFILISCLYEHYVRTVCILFTDSENEDFNDGIKDKD